MVATGCDDGTARLWNTATCAPIGEPPPHSSAVNCLAFSPDGKILATGDEDGIVPVLGHGHPAAALSRVRPHKSRSMAWRSALTAGSSPPGAMTAPPDSGTPPQTRALGLPMEHLGAVTAVASFAPNGRSLATGSGDSVARTWAGPTTRPLNAKITGTDRVQALAYAPDGLTFVTADAGRTTRVHDAVTLEPVGPPKVHKAEIRALAYSSDGISISDRRLGRDKRGSGTPPTSARSATPFETPGAVVALAFRPDGRAFLAAGEDTTAHLWDPYVGRRLGPPLPLESEITALGFSPDGQTIITPKGVPLGSDK